jgi:hypothetical protein
VRATAANVPLIAGSIRSAAAWLEQFGEPLLAMREVPAGEPVEGSAGPGTKVAISGVSDPTGNRASAVVDRSADFRVARQTLECEIHAAVASLERMVSTLSAMRGYLPAPPPRDAGDECRQGCGGPKASGRQGNCEACAKWLQRNPLPDGQRRLEVPTDVLDRRKAGEERRRVHVSGPLAEEALSC